MTAVGDVFMLNTSMLFLRLRLPLEVRHSLGDFLRSSEPSPLFGRPQVGDPREHLSGCAGVAIADVPRELIDGQDTELQ